MQTTDLLMEYIENSPSPYHAVHSAAALLEDAGFTRLEECAPWTLEGGRGYYTTRNQSSLIAFRLPEGAPEGWRLAAAHSDSPTFQARAWRAGWYTWIRICSPYPAWPSTSSGT